ncbi:hypothetical protein C3L33_02518, partial [Rhododendron williamsianum]
MSSISTLCAVDAWVIIFSPNNPEPDVWPQLLNVTVLFDIVRAEYDDALFDVAQGNNLVSLSFIRPVCLFLNVAALLAESFEIKKSHIQEKAKRPDERKANEIKILCDIEACLIIFSPYGPDPDVWPSQLGAQRVISRFRNMSPPEQDRKRVDHESYAQQSLEKDEREGDEAEEGEPTQ